MDFNFGPFGEYLIYTIYLWYITVPAAVLLVWASLHKKNSRKMRWISGIGAAVLLFPVAVFAWYLLSGLIEDGMNRREHEREKIRHTFILKQPETTAGVAFSAGDTIYYAMDFDMNNRKQAQLKDLDSVRLSKPTRFFNLQVKGVIWVDQYHSWHVTLTHQQPVFGWPCIGNVVIDADSTFVRGTLADDYIALGYHLPKGSKVKYEEGLINIILPNSKWLTIDAETKEPLSAEDKDLADSLKHLHHSIKLR
ncbi:hypothetical protein [Pedobacter caeni]|uniref:Uncharacterized protein n=1 Tax=Pedobacter caeni TaxID=288992 RepID=A0A1M4T9E0_9SPHI|nr:hypothetical protein [Pedobacter caeni]SHE41030.1 hypothetical protein SAMN04488522_101124 [Pedobacter caeni]